MAQRRVKHRRAKRARPTAGIRRFYAFDLHLPVFAYQRMEDGGVETPKPIIYGTAFPIAPGVFATAGHVARTARADGIVGLSHMSAAGAAALQYAVLEIQIVNDIDFGVLYCPSLSHLPTIPMDFDRPLDMLAGVSAMGFPMAVDSEFVTVVPRAFSGTVVCRREFYHLPAQPPGYEVSFFAPQGLSGAPLVSVVHGTPACYGYIIQQGTIGIGDEHTPVGLAVGIDSLLGVTIDGKPLAALFGRSFSAPKRSPKRLPGGMAPVNLEEMMKDWPEDLPDLMDSDSGATRRRIEGLGSAARPATEENSNE